MCVGRFKRDLADKCPERLLKASPLLHSFTRWFEKELVPSPTRDEVVVTPQSGDGGDSVCANCPGMSRIM